MIPIYHYDIQQGTDAWHALRAGKWGSSAAATIMGGLETDGLAKLVKRVAWERIYGPIGGGFKSAAMEHGTVTEPEARDWYAFERGAALTECGLVEHATIPNVSWSPDGLQGIVGGVEAKCPQELAWMEVRRTGKIPSEYRWQCRWGQWVGQLEWLDFVAYHPKAGGLIIPSTVTDSEKEQMEARVYELEKRVSAWTDILQSKEPQCQS